MSADPTEPRLRAATTADLSRLERWMQDFNAGEGIEVDAALHEAALRRLLTSPDLGRVWITERDATPCGYAVVTFNFDLEHPGLDAFLTELYVAPDARRRGLARWMLAAVERELRGLDVVMLHLAVRPDNRPALALYEAAGYEPWSRRVFGRSLRND